MLLSFFFFFLALHLHLKRSRRLLVLLLHCFLATCETRVSSHCAHHVWANMQRMLFAEPLSTSSDIPQASVSVVTLRIRRLFDTYIIM